MTMVRATELRHGGQSAPNLTLRRPPRAVSGNIRVTLGGRVRQALPFRRRTSV
jgi:hypothetical protein